MLNISLFTIRHSYTQCTPDTIGCVDINDPGQICPDTLPNAYVGTYYNETVTIWPPPEAVVGEATVTIYKIVIDSIGNIPPGIDYEINATDFSFASGRDEVSGAGGAGGDSFGGGAPAQEEDDIPF